MTDTTGEKKVPNIRFKGFTDAWEQRKLKELSDRVMRKNTHLSSLLPLTISAQDGLVDQTTYFHKQVASKQLANYILVKNGEFAYNKSYSVGYPYGAIKRLNKYDNGVLSTLYIVFKPKNVNSDFLEHYYESSKWYKEIYRNAAEGARNHGLLNISATDFFGSHLLIPKDSEEQEKISKLLNLIDNVLALYQRKYDLLNQLKQGLLQKLFPVTGSKQPDLRFSRFNTDWEKQRLNNITSSYSGGTPSVQNNDYYGGNIPFIRSAEINSQNTELMITAHGLDNSSAKMVKKGDILYALYGATSGEVGISKIDGAINQAIMAIVPKKEIDSYFLMSILRKGKDEIIHKYLQGGQGNLSASIIKNLVFYFPSTSEQQIIANLMIKVDNMLLLHKSKIDKLTNLKKFLLQQMFI